MSRALATARDRFLEAAEAFGRETAAPAWLQRLREEGRARFAERGLPSTRLEEWKYTNVEPLAKLELCAPEPVSVARGAMERVSGPDFGSGRSVFVNGRFDPELSAPGALPGDVRVESLARLAEEAPEWLERHLGHHLDLKAHPFAALNQAFLEDAAVLRVPPGTHVEAPIHLLFLSAGEAERPTAAHPRVLLVAEEGSRVTVVQDHVSTGPGARFTNAVTEVAAGPDAAVELVLLQRENDEGFHVSGLHTRQERDSRVRAHTLALGGSLVRNDACGLLADENAECGLFGLFLGTGRQVVDNHTLIDHSVPHCRSTELYKGVLGGRSRGVFRGRVIVRPDAQKTDASQSNPNLLLTDGAEIDTKPQLEIWADDVKCSHGSAIGRLEEEPLFYLRSRGLTEERAREMLTRGFAAEILDGLPVPALRGAAGEWLEARLRAAREAA